MTDAEKERAAVVAWLMEEAARPIPVRRRLCRRFWMAWVEFRYPGAITAATEKVLASAIERGDYLEAGNG